MERGSSGDGCVLVGDVGVLVRLSVGLRLLTRAVASRSCRCRVGEVVEVRGDDGDDVCASDVGLRCGTCSFDVRRSSWMRPVVCNTVFLNDDLRLLRRPPCASSTSAKTGF